MRRLLAAAAAASALALPSAAQAEPAVGVVAGTNLLAGFDTTAPGTFATLKPITGLSPGEQVAGLDWRYGSPGLYAVTVTGGVQTRVYRVDPGTGAATPVSAATGSLPTGNPRSDIDVNPVADRIRIVNAGNANARLNPDDGTVTVIDSPITNGPVLAIAYDRVVPPSATTVYAIRADGQFGRVGDVNGTPQSANGGTFTGIGALDVIPAAGSHAGLDIAPSGVAYATLTASGGVPALYTFDLASGGATLVGHTPAPLAALAVVPGATVAFGTASFTAAESAGSAPVTVIRAGSLAGTATVAWSASSGPVGTVTFAPGEASRTIAVPVAADAVDEPDEQVTLTLAAPSFPAALGSPAAATLTVADDDPAPDVAAPGVTLARLPRTIAYRKLVRSGLRFTVRPGEPAALDVRLQATTRRARLSRFELTLATRRLPLGGGERRVTLKPARRALRRPSRAVRLRVQVTATDAARNQRVVRRTVRLKR